MVLSRRRFLTGVAGAGALTVMPAAIFDRVIAATSGSDPDEWYFLTSTEVTACQAICARMVPTGGDAVADPGATEANATLFIDRFLAAFELPSSVADGPAIWLMGRYSGRNPYPDNSDGEPSSSFPPDDMLSPDGKAHFIPLDPRQELSWKAQLYGPSVLEEAAKSDPTLAKWASQVSSGLIPGLQGQGFRQLYQEGLAAFDSWSESLFHVSFAQAATIEQDTMLAIAGDIVLDTLSSSLPSLPVGPPAAAEALFPVMLSHTFQGCYGLPEYRWAHQNPLWQEIGYDGDTQPLGNSIYDAGLAGAGPGEGPNEGFGQEGVYVPTGGYREYRAVSELDPDSDGTLLDQEQLMEFFPGKASQAGVAGAVGAAVDNLVGEHGSTKL